MFIHYKTEGIVLKKVDFGEADQFLIIYTKDFGRIEVLARGVRKIASKLRPSADVFCLSRIEFIKGKNYKTLTDAILIEKFKNLRRNLAALKVAYQIADCVEDLIKEEEFDFRIWCLMKETFYLLNFSRYKIPLERYIAIYYYFFWNLVVFLGYKPRIRNCFIQDKKFDFLAVKIINFILKREKDLLLKLRLNKKHLNLLKRISDWYKVNCIK